MIGTDYRKSAEKCGICKVKSYRISALKVSTEENNHGKTTKMSYS